MSTLNMVLLLYFVPLVLSFVFARMKYQRDESESPTAFVILFVLCPGINIISAFFYAIDILCIFSDALDSMDTKEKAERFLKIKSKGKR